MNDTVAPNKTGMAALIGKDSKFVQEIIENQKLNIEIANDNSPMQVVISGEKKDILESKEIFLKNNLKKFVELNVSAAFHSKHMSSAQEKLSFEIDKLNFLENNIKIISNFDANSYSNTKLIRENLQKQMANKVNWTQSIKKLEQIGKIKIVEIGPGKVLGGLINRISKNFVIKTINNISDI